MRCPLAAAVDAYLLAEISTVELRAARAAHTCDSCLAEVSGPFLHAINDEEQP